MNYLDKTKEKKKFIKDLLDFAEILVKIYKTNPSNEIKTSLIDTYKILKNTPVYENESININDIDLNN